MNFRGQVRCGVRRWRRLATDQRASQIVEVAISLPLLVVFVVAIFDFSSAIELKQKLANAAREGARVAASGYANDLGSPGSSGLPVSVGDAFQVVDDYLISENINDCGLGGKKPVLASPLTWTSTSAAGCPGAGITLTINRGCATQEPIGGTTTYVVNTCVTISYAYQWQFNRVIGLLVQGSTYAGVTNLTTTGTAFNEN